MKRSFRKVGWDYAQTSYYLITINLARGSHKFGIIKNNKMVLNSAGRVALDRWLATPEFFPHVELIEQVIMRDHVHFVIQFNRIAKKNTGNGSFAPQRNTLGSTVRSYKSAVTSRLKNDFPTFKWQDGYDDKILFTPASVHRACEYVRNNPSRSH